MIRILHIFHEMDNGGIEHFVMDYYRCLDRTQIQFDFLTSVDREGYFDKEIQDLGGRVFHAYPLKKNLVRSFFDIAKIVRENQYSIVHRHTGSAFGYFELHAAKLGGAKHLILHAHNNQAGKVVLHQIFKTFFRTKCQKFACSQLAGEYLFGKNADYTVINNAIDTGHYTFSKEKRSAIRTELGIGNQFVIGHVGRFEDQKNHKFLIEILKAMLKQKEDCVLVMVGAGKLMHDIKSDVEQLHLEKFVRFAGDQHDAAGFYSAFDAFVLPSKYEGFGITLLEAQANGLYCFTSADVVPQHVNVTGNVRFISLGKSSDIWAKEILKTSARTENTEMMIKNAGFDIQQNTTNLMDFYLQLKNQE